MLLAVPEAVFCLKKGKSITSSSLTKKTVLVGCQGGEVAEGIGPVGKGEGGRKKEQGDASNSFS